MRVWDSPVLNIQWAGLTRCPIKLPWQQNWGCYQCAGDETPFLLVLPSSGSSGSSGAVFLLLGKET